MYLQRDDMFLTYKVVGIPLPYLDISALFMNIYELLF